MTTSCPFQPKRGYVDARAEYLYHFHGIDSDYDDGTNYSDKNNNIPTSSLLASTDVNDRLYFWQLYSLIGEEPIWDIVSDFYERVYSDDEAPWFREAFTALAPKFHHIKAQHAYWVDAFGGGRRYHGGNYRVRFHHSMNAKDVMTVQGAKRWMYHMRSVLVDAHKKETFGKDPRIMPCIVEFLETKMRTYAAENKWVFDKSDFDTLKEALTQDDTRD